MTGVQTCALPILEQTIKGFTMILDGELDDLPEQAFYLIGNIDEAIAKAETLN